MSLSRIRRKMHNHISIDQILSAIQFTQKGFISELPNGWRLRLADTLTGKCWVMTRDRSVESFDSIYFDVDQLLLLKHFLRNSNNWIEPPAPARINFRRGARKGGQ